MSASMIDTTGPSTVLVQSGVRDRLTPTERRGDSRAAGGTVVDLETDPRGGLVVRLRSTAEVSRVVLRWDTPMPEQLLVLGDAWERSYGELAWQHLQADRLLPWYWTGWDAVSGATVGAGVDVGASAFCAWTVDREGVTLWLDVRNGGSPLQLSDRRIELATIRSVSAGVDRPVSRVQRDLVEAMATPIPVPNCPPLVGANNWYYAYGVGFDRAAVLGDARTVVELSDGHPVRPYSVIDAGWTPGGDAPGGPWDAGKPGVFDDMAELADEIKAAGARPGLWCRPLLSRDEADRKWELSRAAGSAEVALDPSRPEVLDRVAEDISRFRDWGYELIKHDFSSYDLFGRFGPAMGLELTDPGWCFADRSRTSAEIIKDFYAVVRDASGPAAVLGCNVVGHLAAGLVDAQRIGDDTSGHHWERTRRMGINTLAHRLPQHRRFFTVDADCVPCTTQVPWRLHRQFLDLVARSGTALFVSVDPKARTDETDRDLAAALKIALDGGAGGGDPDAVEPLDALYATTPADWRFGDTTINYTWADVAGGWPFRT